MAEKLAMDEMYGKIIRDRMWEKFGSFHAFDRLESEPAILNDLGKHIESIDGTCLPKCLPVVEKNLRSMYALWMVKNTFPISPGMYLAYHFNKIFDKDTYLGYSKVWTYPMKKKPDELSLAFNKYLVNITTHFSNGNLNNVSILDLPNFGAMIDSFEDLDCGYIAWSMQLNMAIYTHLMAINNYSWSSNWSNDIWYQCMSLKLDWRTYLNNSTTKNYQSITKNTLFNHTGFIKKDMTAFLSAYASSIKISTPKISTDLTLAANKTFREIGVKNPQHTLEMGQGEVLIFSMKS